MVNMHNKIVAIMIAYNESKFIDCALQSVIDHVDGMIVIEGAFKEFIALGKSPRSTDGTIEIIENFIKRHQDKNIIYRQANEKSDLEQRNVALSLALDMNPTHILIYDADEVYCDYHWRAIKQIAQTTIDVFVFTCMTFVQDYQHYCWQQFPRLFRVRDKSMKFVNDNYVAFNDAAWQQLNKHVLDLRYFHYAFCKGRERFEDKKKWWETRFNKPFHYDWQYDADSQQIKPDNHTIYKFVGKHPIQIRNKFGL